MYMNSKHSNFICFRCKQATSERPASKSFNRPRLDHSLGCHPPFLPFQTSPGQLVRAIAHPGAATRAAASHLRGAAVRAHRGAHSGAPVWPQNSGGQRQRADRWQHQRQPSCGASVGVVFRPVPVSVGHRLPPRRQLASAVHAAAAAGLAGADAKIRNHLDEPRPVGADFFSRSEQQATFRAFQRHFACCLYYGVSWAIERRG